MKNKFNYLKILKMNKKEFKFYNYYALDKSKIKYVIL